MHLFKHFFQHVFFGFNPAFCLIALFYLSLPAADAAANNKDIGRLRSDRSSYDVLHYGIRLRLRPSLKRIEGVNTMRFRMLRSTDRIRFDYAPGMQIDSLFAGDRCIPFQRKGYAVRPQWGETLLKDSVYSLRIVFSGKPRIALQAPWKGGMVWSVDEQNRDWIGMACESTGASFWLPCKDHWSDEADSMDMYLSVPPGLTGVSNGKLISVQAQDSLHTFHWKVIHPINNYNISINAAFYSLIRDTFSGIHTLPMSYYVLDYNRTAAETHFLQVHGMLKAFEHYFGPYPFTGDSYKLVETPYWGMEHQSCIAYGNHYRNNSFGFDFIIIHESGHEWYANSITASDPADMWIHESFTTYAEALYVEYTQGRERSIEYLLGQKNKIVSRSPMQGPRGCFYHDRKDSDIYYKGSWMLHTMRSILGNDSLWFSALRAMNDSFRRSVVSTEDITHFFKRHTGYPWDAFFSQYLYKAHLPELHVKSRETGDGHTEYRLSIHKPAAAFELPLRLPPAAGGKTILLKPGSEAVVVLSSRFDLEAFLNRYYLLNVIRKPA